MSEGLKDMPGSPDDALASMKANLAARTGKTLDEWVALARSGGFAKHGEVVKFLKSEHGLTHGYANMVAMTALENPSLTASTSDLVDAQYSGPKAALRPIYEELTRIVHHFGKDVEISPKKTYVSLRRTKQFALFQPSTKDRIDIGLNLKGVAPSGRLEASGSFNAMCTHRVRISGLTDIDADVVAWLRQAYDAA